MCNCDFKKIVESIKIHEIIYDKDEENRSSFSKGLSADKKQLTLKMHTDTSFCYGTKLMLKLVAIETDDYQRVILENPITSYLTIDQTMNDLVFTMIGDIPIPFGILHVRPVIEDCDPYI